MTSLPSLTNYPKWQCQIGGGHVGQWWMSLVISQSKRILLSLLINEPKKWRFRREMGSFVSFFLPPLSSPFSFFFKTNTGVAWEQIIAACIAASQPFPLVTSVRLQMVNDGISGKDLGKVAFKGPGLPWSRSAKRSPLRPHSGWPSQTPHAVLVAAVDIVVEFHLPLLQTDEGSSCRRCSQEVDGSAPTFPREWKNGLLVCLPDP